MNWDPTPYRDKLNGFAGCVLCHDCGWHERAGALQFCTCEAGEARQKIAATLLLDIAIERTKLAANLK